MKFSKLRYCEGYGSFLCTYLTCTFLFTDYFNPFAAGGYFGQYKMMQKPEKYLNPVYWVLISEYSAKTPMNTNMTRHDGFSKNLCILVLWTKVALALEGLRQK